MSVCGCVISCREGKKGMYDFNLYYKLYQFILFWQKKSVNRTRYNRLEVRSIYLFISHSSYSI